MSDLRKAAEQTLELLEFLEIGNPTIKPCTENLRQALAQQDKMRVEGSGSLTTKPYPDCYQSEQEFKRSLAQPEQETKREWESAFLAGVQWAAKAIQAKLKEKNT